MYKTETKVNIEGRQTPLMISPLTPYDEYIGIERVHGERYLLFYSYERQYVYCVNAVTYKVGEVIPYLTLPFMMCDGTIFRYNRRTKVMEQLVIATDADYDAWEHIQSMYPPFMIGTEEVPRMYIDLNGYVLVDEIYVTEQAFEQITKDAIKLPPVITDYIEEVEIRDDIEIYKCPTNDFHIHKFKNEYTLIVGYSFYKVFEKTFNNYIDAYNEMYKHIGKKAE